MICNLKVLKSFLQPLQFYTPLCVCYVHIDNSICNILLVVKSKLPPVHRICWSERYWGPEQQWRGEEGLDGSADQCFQPAGLQDPGTNACLIELMVLREAVFQLCVYSNKIHSPLAFLSPPSLVINQDCTWLTLSYFSFPFSEVSNEEWCLHFFTSASPHLLNTWTSPFDKQPAPGRKCHRWQMWLWSSRSMKLASWHFCVCKHQSFSVKVLFVLSLLQLVSHYASSLASVQSDWRLYLLSMLAKPLFNQWG